MLAQDSAILPVALACMGVKVEGARTHTKVIFIQI